MASVGVNSEPITQRLECEQEESRLKEGTDQTRPSMSALKVLHTWIGLYVHSPIIQPSFDIVISYTMLAGPLYHGYLSTHVEYHKNVKRTVSRLPVGCYILLD